MFTENLITTDRSLTCLNSEHPDTGQNRALLIPRLAIPLILRYPRMNIPQSEQHQLEEWCLEPGTSAPLVLPSYLRARVAVHPVLVPAQSHYPGRGKYGSAAAQPGKPRSEELQLRLRKLESGGLRRAEGLQRHPEPSAGPRCAGEGTEGWGRAAQDHRSWVELGLAVSELRLSSSRKRGRRDSPLPAGTGRHHGASAWGRVFV